MTLKYFPTDTTGMMEEDRMASGENAVLKRGNTKVIGINPNQVGIGGIPGSDYKQENLTIDGHKATKLIDSKGTYFATIQYEDKTVMASCFSQTAICDQILSTFRFTN